MIAYYGSQISENMTETPEGFLICRNVPIARTGKQLYMPDEIGESGSAPLEVDRPEKEVFSTATLASFEGKDVTDGHPPDEVTLDTHSAYSRGHVENVRRNGDYIVADLHIKDAALIEDIRSGRKREVSCGYTCVYEQDEAGNVRQTNIRGNHVAVVPEGRAGHEVAIKDAATAAEKGEKSMSKKTKALLRWFGMAAKEADDAALERLTADAAELIGSGDEAEPSVDETIPKGDDLGSKLDSVLERLGTIESRLEKVEKGEEKADKLTDETDIDAAIEEAAGEMRADETNEAAVTVPSGEIGQDCDVSKDTYAAILRAMRGTVAGIKDAKDRAAVADALLALRKSDAMKRMHSATADAARKNAEAARATDFDRMCADQKAAYDARNPHKKKEGK